MDQIYCLAIKERNSCRSPKGYFSVSKVRHRNPVNIGAVGLALVASLCIAFLLLPLVALLLHVSFLDVWKQWKESGGQPLWTSLWTSFFSMAVILLFGTPLGWLLARRQTKRWKVVELVLLVPLLMPPLVIGLLLVYFYGPYGPIGSVLGHFGVSASNSNLAVILAQLYESVPYYVFSAQAAFRQVDQRLERTSMSLGVRPWQTFRRITLPLAWPGLTVGFAMSFARAIGAFGAVIVVAYHPYTLPVSIWIALQEQGLPAALPLALLLLLVGLPLPIFAFAGRRQARAGVSL